MEEFLTELGRRGHEPLLAAASGTIRFDVHRGGRTEHRLVKVDRGDVTVTTGKNKADAVVEADAEVLDRIATGEVNATAAVLRGALHIEGNPELLVQLQRTFPGPSNAPAPATRPPAKKAAAKRPAAEKPAASRSAAKKPAAKKPAAKKAVRKAAA